MALEKKYQADVIVIGGGIAGITTALELLDNNVSVALIDRDERRFFGGQAITAFGGMLLAGTPEQRKSKVSDSAELFLSDWLRFSEFSDNDVFPIKWAELYCERSRPDVYEWVRNKGVKFLPQVVWSERGLLAPGNTLPRYHIIWGTGYVLTSILIEHLINHKNRNKLQLHFGHHVQGISKSAGKATGCAGVLEETGEPFSAHGNAVVIAAGGIGGDIERVKKQWPASLNSPPEKLFIGTHPYCNGELHDRIQELGGNVTNVQYLWNYPAGIHHPQPKFEGQGLALIPFRSALWMDSRGRRFGPQPLIGYYDTRYLWHRICQQKDKYSWLVLNRKIALKELALSGAEHNQAIRDKNLPRMIKNLIFGQKELLEDMIQNSPDFLTATTLEELVAKMNGLTGANDVDLAGMSRDISDYDAQIERGPAFHADDQLRRIAHLRNYKADKLRTCKFQKINDPNALPLIAIRCHILIRKSLGGIQTDLESRVLDDRLGPIPGLYAVGEAAGFGGGGSNGKRSLEGLFISNCILTGRAAGRAISGQRKNP